MHPLRHLADTAGSNHKAIPLRVPFPVGSLLPGNPLFPEVLHQFRGNLRSQHSHLCVFQKQLLGLQCFDREITAYWDDEQLAEAAKPSMNLACEDHGKEVTHFYYRVSDA